MTDEQDQKEKPTGEMIENKLFASRTILLYGQIDHKQAKSICAQLLALDAESDAPIRMMISSPGGHVESGDSIHDMIRYVKAPVTTIGTGWVASAGTHIFLSAPKERRVCLPNTRFLIHQPSGSAGGQSTDIAIQAEQIIKMRERMAGTIAEATGQTVKKVLADIERDYWMTTEEAIEYGILGKVITSASELD